MWQATPSRTACEVARTLVYLGRDPRAAPLLPRGAADATARLLVAAGLLPWWMRALMANVAFRVVSDRLAAHIGGRLHFGLRKRFVDDEVRAALAEGARQVLVVGAGYDTLGMRLAAQHPERLFVEIDHPATQALKRAALEAMGAARPNLRLVPVDLATTPLTDALATVGDWAESATSAVVAEGLLMYLDEAAVATFLDAVFAATGPGSRLVTTWMRGDAAGIPAMGFYGQLLRIGVAVLGEPFRWGVPDETALAAFLGAHGFRFAPAPARFDLARRYLAPAGLPDDGESALPELMAVAERR